jgi:predicted ATPase/class 3 adenylate cyclase
MSPRPPAGTVTFLFTDIEGSTRLWEERADEMRAALAEHDALLRRAIETHGGYVFATGGDGFAVAFPRAADAVAAATEAQAALASVTSEPVLRVRMGIHTGEAQERNGDYFGPVLNRAARVMAVGHGGQILVSATTAGLVGSGTRLIDLGEHLLRDLGEPVHVFQLDTGGPPFPPLRSLSVLPNNLPVQLSEFIGRTDEIDAVAKLVVAHRLVTLTGVGGVGKTRLALRVAGENVAAFPDGIWLAELALVGDPMMVGATVARAVGLTALEGRGPIDALTQHCAARSMLIVLDNCEHVIGAVAELVERLLAAAPATRILATSREALGALGERAWPVPSITTDDSVALFVERARAADPHFAGDAAIAELCARLDGIPLAIELAASRVGSMSVAQITERLHQRFRLLTRGRRTALERHQTLRATVDWSYDLLDDLEREVFSRLAAFAGTFDLEAAEAVASGGDVLDVDVDDALSGLVSKSMLTPVRSADGLRYRMLETLRQYALERLVESGFADAVQRRHASHYLARAERFAPRFETPGDADALAEARRDIDEYRLAFDWLVEVGDIEGADRLDAALDGFWWEELPAEGYERSRSLLDLGLDPSREVEVLTRTAFRAYVTGRGDFDEPVQRAVERAGDLGLDAPVRALLMLSMHAWNGSRWPELEDWARQAEVAADARGSAYEQVYARQCAVGALYGVGRVAEARHGAQDVLERARAAGGFAEAMVAISFGFCERTLDRLRAVELLELAYDRVGDRDTTMGFNVRWRLAVSYAGIGRARESLLLFADAIEGQDRCGATGVVTAVLSEAAEALLMAGQREAAIAVAALADQRLDGGDSLHIAAREAHQRLRDAGLVPAATDRTTITVKQAIALLRNASQELTP